MKLDAIIAETHSVIEIRDQGERVWADVDGRIYQLDLQPARAGRYVVLSEGQVFECRVDGTPVSGKAVEVSVNNQQFPVTISDPKRLRSAASAAVHADQAAQIVAAMPGKVVRVAVESGAQVEAGDGIVVVEAMKMQNEMKSPKAGTVSVLKVKPGDTVNAGDVLAVIE